MSDEIKKYLDSANFKFKDIDENGYLFLLPSEISVLFSIIKGEE